MTDAKATEIATELDADRDGAGSDRAALVVREGETTRVIDIDDGGEVTIGRSADATIAIDDAKASRVHARVARRGISLFAEDLGSRNGTRLNGVRLTVERPLAAGDVMQIGRVEILVAMIRSRPEAGPVEPSEDVIVADPATIEVFAVARRLANTPTTVLITGETGSGKEVLAEQIHRWSSRAARPFVRINCASVPETLLESELFGYERGAFTGATKRKPGHFEAASGGTLLLDEIGDMPQSMQAKLLRVLERRAVVRLGASEETPVDVRVLCATHHDLAGLASKGRFRSDLFYRIGAFVLEVPPLRDRPAELLLLADRFCRDFASKIGAPLSAIRPDAQAALAAYRWPGNVRELRNAIEHAVVMASGGPIEARHLPRTLFHSTSSGKTGQNVGAMRDHLDEIEKKTIEEALAEHDGNRTHAAQKLGISRRALVYKLAKYGIG